MQMCARCNLVIWSQKFCLNRALDCMPAMPTYSNHKSGASFALRSDMICNNVCGGPPPWGSSLVFFRSPLVGYSINMPGFCLMISKCGAVNPPHPNFFLAPSIVPMQLCSCLFASPTQFQLSWQAGEGRAL